MTNIITLFSSTSTTKYIKDIFAVLALPRGANYRFRYEKQYVELAVQTIFDNRENTVGTKALVAFRSKSTEGETNRFIVPIRWVEITEIETVANFYRITFKVLGYPKFSLTFTQQCSQFNTINKISISILSNANTNELAVINNCLSIVDNDNQDDVKNDNAYWLNIVTGLSCIPQYKNYYFFKCSNFFCDCNKKKLCAFENNHTILEEGNCAYLQIEYYQKEYNVTNDSSIDVFFDKNIISQSLGLRTKIDARYDSLILGFQAKNTMNETHSEIIICTSEERDKLQTELSLPVMIVKRKSSLIWKSVIMSIGALLVGLPALLPDTVCLTYKIIIAGVGACVMGINHFINLKGK